MSSQPRPVHASAVAMHPNHSLRGDILVLVSASVSMVMTQQMRNAIKQTHDEEPYRVDKVPISRHHLIRPVRRSAHDAIARENAYKHKKQYAHNHMGGMQCGNRVEDGTVGIAIGSDIFPLRRIFESLDHEKHEPQNDGDPQRNSARAKAVFEHLELAPMQHDAAAHQYGQQYKRINEAR